MCFSKSPNFKRNDSEIEKYTQDCTFFKFYLACYNFFASYTCVIVFFIILCTTKKRKKLNDYLYREGGKEWWGMYSIIRQARRKRSLFLKHSFFVSFFYIISVLFFFIWLRVDCCLLCMYLTIMVWGIFLLSFKLWGLPHILLGWIWSLLWINERGRTV